jgi:type II secretory pathway pseudopilin PulG
MISNALDERVWALLCRLLAYPDIVTQELVKRHATSGAALIADVEAYERGLAKIQDSERAGIALAMSAADEVQRSEAQAQLALVAKQRQAAQLALQQAKRRLDNQRRLTANLAVTGQQLRRSSSRLDTATWQDKRKAVQALVKKVRIWPGHGARRWEITIQIPKFVTLDIEGGEVIGIDSSSMSE